MVKRSTNLFFVKVVDVYSGVRLYENKKILEIGQQFPLGKDSKPILQDVKFERFTDSFLHHFN